MTRDRLTAVAAALLWACCSLFGQDQGAPAVPIEQSAPAAAQTQQLGALLDPNVRLAVAVATQGYPVTPGDVYTLTYLTAGQTVVYDVTVQSDYSVDLRLFGRVRGDSRSFQELRADAEAIIARAYPNSVPSLIIKSVGVFPVAVKGAVKQPGRMIAWGLSRLSDVLRDGIEPHGSDRDVQVVSRNGWSMRYDLLRARRLGDDTQDPLVRPGDTVTVFPASRTVSVGGEVRRPGVYHLIDLDTPEELLLRYCGGLTPLADQSRVRLESIKGGRIEAAYLPLEQLAKVPLADGDSITVPSTNELRPVVTFEGAIRPSAEMAASSTIETTVDLGDPYVTMQVPVAPGETLFHAFLGIKDQIVPNADLARASILRSGQSLPVDLYRLTNEYSRDRDPLLEPFDRILIPSTRYTITVSGAVVNPGSYYYTPGKPASYYVALAGGADPERNTKGSLVAYDAAGDPLPIDVPLLPGARVVVLSNNSVYNFNRYFPIIATTLTFVTSVIAVIDLLGK